MGIFSIKFVIGTLLFFVSTFFILVFTYKRSQTLPQEWNLRLENKIYKKVIKHIKKNERLNKKEFIKILKYTKIKTVKGFIGVKDFNKYIYYFTNKMIEQGKLKTKMEKGERIYYI
ncbi:hypothetical protein WG909_14605 [Peptostreptococcaceae bacterium AGR-M142]